MPDETRLPIPDETIPEDSWCFRVHVPASKAHVQLFVGALEKLAFWNTWERDSAHNGLLLAARWKQVIDELLSECGLMDVRQNATLPCILEKTEDGETWEQFADLKKCPPQIRFRNGIAQYSTDGGTTWSNVPSSTGDSVYDPRTDDPMQPARTGTNIPCLAAANAVACLVELHKEIVAWYDANQAGLVLLGAISLALGIFFPLSWMIFGLSLSGTALATLVLAHIESLNNAAFTSTIQQELACILYCNADSSGRWDQTAFDAILAEVDAKTGDMWELLHVYLEQVGGPVGLSNAGTTTSVASYDCTACSCGWCYEFDFSAGDGGWAAVVNSAFTPSTLSSYGSGAWNYVSVYSTSTPQNRWRQSHIQKTMNATLTKIEVYYDVAKGNTDNPAVYPRLSITNFAQWAGISDGVNQVRTWTGSQAVTTYLRVTLECGFKSNSTYPTSTGRILKVKLWGTGECPFGESNCV